MKGRDTKLHSFSRQTNRKCQIQGQKIEPFKGTIHPTQYGEINAVLCDAIEQFPMESNSPRGLGSGNAIATISVIEL